MNPKQYAKGKRSARVVARNSERWGGREGGKQTLEIWIT
jgi:hypothetical protein